MKRVALFLGAAIVAATTSQLQAMPIQPLAEAALWLNRYAKYWQAQFETLALHLTRIEQERETP